MAINYRENHVAGEPISPFIEVTKKDSEYVDLMVEYHVSKPVKDQFNAFMSGFNELNPQNLITVFDERELEWLIGGMTDIDVYAILLFFLFSTISDQQC